MNILAIGAHPDDIEILCAGTLARYAQQSHAIFLASFTSGNMGDLHIPPPELARIRKKEAEASAAILGARLFWPAIDDELVFPDEAQRRVMIDLIRQADPDVIFTHSPSDYHPTTATCRSLCSTPIFRKACRTCHNRTTPPAASAPLSVLYGQPRRIGFSPAETWTSRRRWIRNAGCSSAIKARSSLCGNSRTPI
jgi:LmbE family N-acetylglucosaminyl deacetylase